MASPQQEAQILRTLDRALAALQISHNCLITDRPDLPRSPETGWTSDYRELIADIETAKDLLTPPDLGTLAKLDCMEGLSHG